MANSIPERLSRGQRIGVASAASLAAVAVLCGAASTDGRTTMADCKESTSMDSPGPVRIDEKSHLMTWSHGVKISGCDISVSADSAQATGQDFENTKWVFTGMVHVRTESQGDLYSDQASVEFRNKLLARAIATGSPARFEQTPTAAGAPVKGHASTIDYDVLAGTVKFTGDAWLARGDNKMEAPSVTYNVRDRTVLGDVGATGGRVHMTIVPKSDGQAKP